MNEVEKLYRNAEVKSIGFNTYTLEDEYPPFTAEKQLNLIIFLANREIVISPTYISSGYSLNNAIKIQSSRNISSFADSLAQHINAIWQDLTEEEKQQVKGILE